MARAARKPYQRLVTYISKTVNFDTPGIGTAATVSIGALPAGCLVLETLVRVRTAFDAGTTNVIKVGTSDDDDEFIEANDLDETGAGLTRSERSAGLVMTADTEVFVTYTQTGTAATAGVADVIVLYIPEVEA
jgi:hypothetical protein